MNWLTKKVCVIDNPENFPVSSEQRKTFYIKINLLIRDNETCLQYFVSFSYQNNTSFEMQFINSVTMIIRSLNQPIRKLIQSHSMKLSISHFSALFSFFFVINLVSGQNVSTIADFKVTAFFINGVDSSASIMNKSLHFVFYAPEDQPIGLSIFSDSSFRQIYGPLQISSKQYTKARIKKKVNHLYHFEWDYSDTETNDEGLVQITIIQFRTRLKKEYLLIIQYEEDLQHVYAGKMDGKMTFLSKKPYKTAT